MFVTFGQYGFNKSHSICYVTIGYACAWLKYHFPLEWWTAVLKNADRNEIDEKFWGVCGHLIDIPDVQSSGATFVINNERIKAPLSLLHGIGEKAHAQLVQYAPYTDIKDFCDKILAHKEVGAKIVESTVKDKKTGALKKVMKKKLGTSALNSRVVNTLIISGSMDTLFPATKSVVLTDSTMELKLDPIDKILMYQTTLEQVTGKKLPKKKKEELEQEFSALTDMKQFQMKKKVLPAYNEDMLPVCLKQVKGFSKDKGGDYIYTPEGGKKKSVMVFGKILINSFSLADSMDLYPEGGLEAGVLAYIVMERRFSYGDATKKTAVEIIADIDGERLKLVQWPNDLNQLPKVFDNNLNGAIVVLSLSKKSDKAVRLKGLYLIESGMDTKKLEEESPEPEESNE